MGIVRDIGQDITDEEIVNIGKGLSPEVKCIRVRRFNRRKVTENGTIFVKTNTCVLTFEGTTLPKYFELYTIRLPVELYIPPVVQCNKCLRYGHVRNLCRGKFRCRKCGSYHEDEKPCDLEPCCIHCQQGHEATDRKCQEYARQVKMREIMALHNVSLYEADKTCRRQIAPRLPEFPTLPHDRSETSLMNSRKQSYANVVATNQSRSYGSVRPISSAPSPKRKISEQTGYDRAAHNACLIPSRPVSPIISYSRTPIQLSKTSVS
ncbi:uncharacterized protein LOC123673382 [Harmonia axyridis]|uniref:uncharacterized protein LOC123673382 n=1 Tax=Harmonia axyridis TaxID=115357 RepID=UPI001E2762FA|nr:uncharacterized protein LOC123673382 [Harmonia axyridis]